MTTYVDQPLDILRSLPYGVGGAIVLVTDREKDGNDPVKYLSAAITLLTDAIDNNVYYKVNAKLHKASETLVREEPDALVSQFLWALLRRSNPTLVGGWDYADLDLAIETLKILRDRYAQETIPNVD